MTSLLLLDLKDIRSLLTNIAERAKKLARPMAIVTTATIGAIRAKLLVLEQLEGGRNVLWRTRTPRFPTSCAPRAMAAAP
ncbi:MAG: helicase HerA-like domain-containing protein [Nitratireductor sp.]